MQLNIFLRQPRIPNAPADPENRAAKEREREEAEKRRAQRAADARAAKIAAEVAKKRAVEERLRSGSRKSVASSAPAAKAAAPAKKAPVMRKGSSFDSLLSQIESEKARIDAEASCAPRSGPRTVLIWLIDGISPPSRFVRTKMTRRRPTRRSKLRLPPPL